ncbi:MAG: TatD family hydrolase, partial [Nanoarchaeota archaeon]
LSTIITNGTSSKDNRKVMSIADKLIKPALGIYPEEAIALTEEDFEEELSWIKKQKPAAIGEIGLDSTYPKIEKQKQRFIAQLELAKSLKIPAIIHSRKAESRILEVLKDLDTKKAVLHCFCGKLKLLDEATRYKFSIPANIGYSTHFQEMVKRLSNNQLLTETDAPYLGPVKTQRNEPKNVVFAVKKIAQLKGLTEEDMKNVLFQNYQALFL